MSYESKEGTDTNLDESTRDDKGHKRPNEGTNEEYESISNLLQYATACGTCRNGFYHDFESQNSKKKSM